MEQFLETLKKSAAELYAKLRDLFLSMTLGNRIVAALLMATLLVSLGYLFVGSISTGEIGSKTIKMYDGYQFSANEKGAAEYAFSKAGLSEHNWLGNQLQVPKSKKAAYALALADADVLEKNGLARRSQANEISPWHSSRMMDTKMRAAQEQDCIDAIKLIPGISNVSILTNKRPEWETNVWSRKMVTSVSVIIEAIETKPLKIETINAIGNLVAPAFGITDRKEISVIDSKNSMAYDGFGEELSSAQGEYLRHQIRHQEIWNDRIFKLLPRIEGLKVDASVTLSTYRHQNVFTVEHDRPTPLVTHELDVHNKREGWDRFFRLGVIAQWNRTLIDPTGNIGPQNLVDEKKREQEITHALPGTEMKEEKLPYIPQRITTTIQVPREHILKIWRERSRQLGSLDANPTDEQLAAAEAAFATDIKRSIGKLLEPYRAGKEDPMNLVEVIYYDLMRPEEVVLTAWEQFLLFMQQHWQSLGLMGLVCGGLVVLWSISKPPKPENIVIYEGLETPLDAIDARIAEKIRREEEEAARLAAEEAAIQQEEFENSLGELGSLRSLKDEIAELIAKNPEAAAAVIRQWIGNAVLVEAKS